MAKAKAVVLLSAGLDSSYNLFVAHQQMDVQLVLTFDYGQKASTAEIRQSAYLARSLHLKHHVLPLPWFSDFTHTALVSHQEALPTADEIQIEDLKTSQASAKRVWVPNRNGIFLNIAAAFAEGLSAEYIVPGFNLEEAQTFPDNSESYLKALDHSFSFSTANQVKTRCFSTRLDKTEIVAEALKISVPLKELWPCYTAEPTWCGVCESCLRFKNALKKNGLSFDELKHEV